MKWLKKRNATPEEMAAAKRSSRLGNYTMTTFIAGGPIGLYVLCQSIKYYVAMRRHDELVMMQCERKARFVWKWTLILVFSFYGIIIIGFGVAWLCGR